MRVVADLTSQQLEAAAGKPANSVADDLLIMTRQTYEAFQSVVFYGAREPPGNSAHDVLLGNGASLCGRHGGKNPLPSEFVPRRRGHRTPARFLNGRLRGREACDRDTEGRATHVVQTRLVAEFHRPGVAPCSPQIPITRSGRTPRPSSTAIRMIFPTPSASRVSNGLSGSTFCSM